MGGPQLSLTLSLSCPLALQDTLEEANALLDELEARDSRQAPQITERSGTGSETVDKNQTGENNMESTGGSSQSNLDRDRDRIEG